MRRRWIASAVWVLWIACHPSERDPGTLVIGLEGNPTSLDPRFAVDAHSQRIASLLYNGLLRIGPDGRLEPDAAQSWRWADPTVLEFTLRPGLAFHDGAPLDCPAVRLNLLWVALPTNGSPKAASLEPMAGVECDGPRQLTLRLKAPQAAFPMALTLGLLAPSQLDADAEHPIGSGPYRIVEWVPDSEVILERAADSGASIRRIRFRFLTDETTRLLEMRKGTIDLLINAVPPHKLRLIENNPALVVESRPGHTYAYIGMNGRHPVLANPAVRRALALAVDRDRLLKERLAGRAEKAEGPLPRSSWAWADLPPLPCDPDQAARSLDEAGYPIGADGWRFRLRYHTSTNDESLIQAEILKSQWEAVGVRIDIRSYEWGTFFRDIKNGEYDLFSLRWIGLLEPDALYDIYHSTRLPPGGANRLFYADPEVDRWLEAGRREIDPALRAPYYRRVQERLARDLPAIGLFHLDDLMVRNHRLVDFDPYPGGLLTGLVSARLVP